MTTDTSDGDTMLADTMLSDRLEQAGHRIEVPMGPGPGAIRERARRRTRRNRAARVVAAVAFVAIGGVALANAVTDPSDHVAADVNADDYRRPTAAELNGALPPDEVEPPVWRAVGVDDLGDNTFGTNPVWTGERFLLPTSDGLGRAVVLASPDGEDWQALPTLDGWISSVAEVDGTVWAVAETVDSGPTGAFRLPPGASEWEPIELPASDDPRFSGAAPAGSTIVAGSSGEVWLITQAFTDGVHAFLIEQGYLSDEKLESNSYGWGVDRDTLRVEVYDDGGSVTEQLEIPVSEVEAALNGSNAGDRFRVLRVDGSRGAAQEVAVVGGSVRDGGLADGDGLLLAGWNGSWDPLSGGDGPSSVLWRIDDEGVEVVESFGHEADVSLASGLGRHWVLTNEWASGPGVRLNELGRPTGERLPYVQGLVGGEGALVATGWPYDPDRSIVESGLDLFDAVFGRDSGQSSSLVAVSTDGEHWSWQTTEEVFGASIDQANLAVGGGRILAVGWDYDENGVTPSLAVADLDGP